MVQKKNTPLSPYTKVTVLRTAKTLRDEFVEIEGQGWVNKAFVTEKDNRMEKVQDLLNSKYNSPSYGIYVKQLTTGNTAGINPQKKCILPVSQNYHTCTTSKNSLIKSHFSNYNLQIYSRSQ